MLARSIRDCQGPVRAGSLSSPESFGHSHFQDQEETSQTVLSCCGSVGAAVLPTLITAPQTGHPLLQCQSTRTVHGFARTFLVWLLGAPQHVQCTRNYHQPKQNNLFTVPSLIVLFIIHINWHLALILNCSPFSEQLLLLSCWSTRSIKSFHTILRRYIIYFSLRKSARFIALQMHTSQKETDIVLLAWCMVAPGD